MITVDCSERKSMKEWKFCQTSVRGLPHLEHSLFIWGVLTENMRGEREWVTHSVLGPFIEEQSQRH